MGNLLVYAWLELKRRKARTFSNIFGYFLAVSIMMILATVIIFSNHAAEEVLTNTGTHFITYVPYSASYGDQSLITCTTCDVHTDKTGTEGFIADGIRTQVISMEAVQNAKTLSTVKDVSPYLLFRLRDEKDKHLFTVGGIKTENNKAIYNNACAPNNIIQGRFIAAGDQGAIMLEEGYANNFNVKVGDHIVRANQTFLVIGIVNCGIRPGKADIYMRFEDAEAVINSKLLKPLNNQFNILLVEVKNAKHQTEAMAAIKKLINGIISSYNCYQPAAKVMGMNENSIWILLTIMIGGMIFISAKTQFTSVVERRRDIGILKAIGWNDQDIIMQIIMESVIQAFTGGILACIVSAGVLLYVPIQQFISIDTAINISLSWEIIMLGIILSIAGGIIAGLFPAISTVRQNPAEALRKI